MYKEYESVIAKKDLNSSIKKGSKGTIVCDPSLGPSEHYLVEFFDDNNNSIEVIEVKAQDIDLLK